MNMRRFVAALAVPAALCVTLVAPLPVQAHSMQYSTPVNINPANLLEFTSVLNLTDPNSTGTAVGSSLFTAQMDKVTGAFRFKVDILEPLKGMDLSKGIMDNQNLFTVHLHGSLNVLTKDGKPVFSCKGAACLTEPRNPVPNQGPQSAATQLWSFHDVHSGEWINLPNLFTGGDTGQMDKPRSLSRIGGLAESTRRDLGLTRLDDMLLGFWYAHTQTEANHQGADNANNRVRGFLTPVNAAPVPLPGAAWLFMSALTALGAFRRRSANAAA